MSKPDPKAISAAEAELRNLRDAMQSAQEKVREWQTRAKIDPALMNYDLADFDADIVASEEAFRAFSIATINVARLRLGERQYLMDYAAAQGRERPAPAPRAE